MHNFLNIFQKKPDLKNLGLKPYQITFALDRLVFGVDNIHLDVHISPQVYSCLRKTVFLLMVKHSKTENFFKEYKKDLCETEKEALKRLCNDILLDGINKAKLTSEVQIDFLGQIALLKLFLEEIKSQYKFILSQIEQRGRMYQISEKHDQNDVFLMKEKLSEIKIHYNQIVRGVGKELFEQLVDVNTGNLRNMRETHFAPRAILPNFYFSNPLFHTNNPNDDFFLTEEYALMGQRAEDIDNYNNIKASLYSLLKHIHFTGDDYKNGNAKKNEIRLQAVNGFCKDENRDVDALIMDPDNMDRMFDYFSSTEQYDKAKQANEPEAELKQYREKIETQKTLLNLAYRKFDQSGILRQMVAALVMKKVYEKFCPPMAPRQVREFLVNFWTRLSARTQQKRLKALYGSDFSIAPLWETLKHVRRCSSNEKRQYLIMFLRQFSRYHRDLYNFHIFKEAMDAINLVEDEKIILLSRENHSLYEFLLPDEKVKEEKPIANHVIIKADIRGSMAINHTMRTKGLNPASYFSLNFFDPISQVLSEYGAAKVFIEGDAIILSIFESEDIAEGYYSVARACGLAMRILQIVQSYNEKNKENNLPVLELGIGICFCQGPPMFLFDGDSRIMISQAINQADRLSSCDKFLRKIFKSQNDVFNLFVFENESEEISETGIDESTYRYNVNGIELNEEGFQKLTREINLQKYTFSSDNDDSVKLYTGKVPLLNGNYQRIAIREALIHKVQPDMMDVSGKISRKYYEVCTHNKIYNFIENQS
ncbi:MAG: hypothetical protein WBN66_08080 [Smithella sp.]